MDIKIKDKKYIGQCNALSYIFYKKIFNTNIFDDLKTFKKTLIDVENGNDNEENILRFYEILQRFIYVLLYTKDQNIEDYEEWKSLLELENITEKVTNSTIEIITKSFLDEEVNQELEKIPENDMKESIFAEHSFLNLCLSYGLTIEDLKILTYTDVLKMCISVYLKNKETEKRKKKGRKATQADWDKLASL